MAIDGKAAPPLGPGAEWTPAFETRSGYDWQAIIANLTDASGNQVEVQELDGDYSLATVPGHSHRDAVHFDVSGVAVETGYMLIDLSDTTTWPHSNTDHLDLHYLLLHIDPDAAFLGSVIIGFLSDVNSTDGSLHHLMEFSFLKKSDVWTQPMDFGGPGQHLALQTTHLLGDTDANDATWQDDVAIAGPAGGTYNSGNGDLVMKVTRTAGTVDVSLTLLYEARA